MPLVLFMSNGKGSVARVLCTGFDRPLLQTRRMLLEQAGHRVITATTEDDVRHACAEQGFEVAVIGQSVVAPEKVRILRLVRELCPEVKVLELYQPHVGKLLGDADAWLEVPAAIPRDFVQRVTELAENPQTPRRRRQA